MKRKVLFCVWFKYISECEEHPSFDFKQSKKPIEFGPNWESQKRFTRKHLIQDDSK